MIVAERKPIEEIKGFLAGHKRILVLGCGTCVTPVLAFARKHGGRRLKKGYYSGLRPETFG